MIIDTMKKFIIDTAKLFWPFKWYIVGYLWWWAFSVTEYLNPPAANDPILKYEYGRGAWNYVSQEVYIESMKLFIREDTLVFLLAASNMRHHPLLAKIILLSPWLLTLCGAVLLLGQWLIEKI